MQEHKYPTPHINATPDDFAKTVLMPGDPLRSKFIAENFLENPVLINNVRGAQGYTGIWKEKRVSVMASGMGMPSMGIYSYELFNFFGVENIIRVGSAGAMQPHIKLYDIVLGMGACTNSDYAAQYGLQGVFAPTADYHLLKIAEDEAIKLGAKVHVGNIFSSDIFYNDDPTSSLCWSKMGVLAVEMEAAALYMNAARSGRHALAICTISDNLLTGELTTAKERQSAFTQMIEAALNTAAAIS